MEHLPHFALILLLLFTTRAMEPGITRTEMNLHGGNVDSVDELWSIFVRTSLVICQPDSAQFRCPPRMHIRPLITSVLTDPSQLPRSENVSPHCFRNDVSRWTKDPRQLNKLLHQCRLVDEHETVRHLCEGRNMCRVSVDSFFSNKSADCTQLNVPIKLEYKCLPDPNSASFEAICADTYMEVKCDSQVKGNTLVILTARLEKQIHVQLAREHPKHPKQGCPTLPVEHTSTACNTRIDVTQHFQSACDGRSSCSVSPSMADSKPEFTKMCGKMHLSLTYVCVPSDIVITEKHLDKSDDVDATGRVSAKGRKNQRQPKGVIDPKLLIPRGHKTTRVNEPSSRDTRQLVEPPANNPVDQSQNARISPKINSSPTKTNSESMTILNPSSNSSLQPLFIALGVGLVVLLIAMVLVIVACRKSRVPISRKRPKQRQQQQPDPGLMAKHTCDLRTSFWSTGRQTSESSSWMEKKHQQHRQQQPCKACHSHDINSPSKMAVSCDPCHAESCRCGVPSSISSTGHNTGLDHSCSTVGGGGISGCVPLVELQNSFHPCCNSSGPCAGHSPNPRLPLGSCGLSALSGINEGFPVPLDNIQYVVGLHTNELTKGLLTYPDQRSLSKSNSSSSGVGVNSAQMTVYGSPYPLGTALGSPAQAGARIDSVAYSTAHKESPMAESSSGRGCDGGSGTSEPSETFHFTCPRSRPSCHAISNPLTNRQLMNYLPIPGSVMPMNASDYMSRVSSQCGIGSTSYDATSARSLISVVSRPGRTDTSPRPSFRSSTSTERNLTTPPGYLPKIGTDRTLGLDYVTEHPNSRETYDQVPAYHQVLESELCSQTTLHRPPSQRGHYSILPSMEPESISDAHAPISFDQGSSESLTVPLLEPPSNFRSPTKLLNSSGTTDYIGLDAEDDLSNLQSNQKLADMIIHKTNRTTDVGDGVEQPPPPIAPLRVFANSSNLIGLGKDSCYFSAR